MTRVVQQLLFFGILVLLALPAPALASPDEAIRDCARDGDLDRRYSNSDLREARDKLPADLAEYSDCGDVFASAIKGGSNLGGGSGSQGVGATDPEGEAAARGEDASDLAALAEGAGGDGAPVDVGGTSLAPDSSGFFNLGGAANEVPLPLLLALLLLALLALASGFGALKERVPALARMPALSKIPTPRVPFLSRRS